MNYNDLNVDMSDIIDLINIKSFPEMIAVYLRINGSKKYNNLRKFYSSMLDYFEEDIKSSYLNRILKYLSSDKESKIYLIDDINDGLYDDQLLKFSSDLVKIINKTPDYSKLYDSINSKINFIFYDPENEYYNIKESNNKKEYDKFIFYLLKHSFKNYKISVPGIVGKRLYMSTQTVRPNLPRYIKALNAGSLLGNDDCTMQLYSIISPDDYNLAINILLRSKENEMVLWIIAYNMEIHILKKEIINVIKEKYKHIFEYHDDFIDNICLTKHGKEKHNPNLLYAYKIYYYCYKKYDFTKAGNSVGKLLLYDAVWYCNNRDKSIEFAKEILQKEIYRGNTDSITNLAIYCYDNPSDNNQYSISQIKELLRSPSSLGEVSANYYLGKILFDEGNYEESFKYLEFASNQNNKHANLLLGKYYELLDNLVEAKKSYKKGIANGNFDCAYYLALLYFDLNKTSDNDALYIKGYELISKYYDLFSGSIKESANQILKKKNS